MLEDKDLSLTPISKIGEFGMIEKIREAFPVTDSAVHKGIGDDAAVYDAGDGVSHVVSTDLLVEGVHFDLSYVPLRHLGFKAVAVNVSDIAAMNAKAFGITVSVALSSRFSVEALEEFYAGVQIACEEYGITLLGGDTSSSRSGLVISVTALGKAKTENIVYRSGAKETDLICVSGDLGGAYAGLQVLEREKAVFQKNPDMQPQLEDFSYVVGRQLKPAARTDVIELLNRLGVKPNSMIDISDGLASDLLHICKESDTGAVLYEEKLPIDHKTQQVAEEFNIHPATYVMNGGEDYELMFTINIHDFEKIKSIPEIFVIGHITDKNAGISMVGLQGQQFEITAQGWDHFKGSE